MEAVASRSATWWPDALRRVEPDAVRTWALTGTIVLYLAIDGGGYDQVVWSQVAIVVWWIVLIGAAWGLLPAGRWTRAAWTALALFAGFVAWTALATTWSLSSERSLQDLSRVACYLGVLLLGISIHRDRARAVKHTIHAVAAAVVVVACLALASRLRPDLFPAAYQTASFLPGTAGRLGWPLNYWNALAALMALGAAAAARDRHLGSDPAGSGRGGGGHPDRDAVWLPDLLPWGRGVGRRRAARIPSPQPGAGRKARHGGGDGCRRRRPDPGRAPIARRSSRGSRTPPRTTRATRCWLRSSSCAPAWRWPRPASGSPSVMERRRAGSRPRPAAPGRSCSGGVAVCVVVALLAGAPARIGHAWQDFKHPGAQQRSTRTRSRASGARAGTDGTTTGRWRSTPPAATCSAGPALARSSCCGTRALRTTAPSRTRTRCTSRRSRKPASSGWLCSGRSSCWCSGLPSG